TIHSRVVCIQCVENRMGANRLIEKALQRTWSDSPGIVGVVAGSAAPAIRTLSLEVIACQIDEALRAECRGTTDRILDWLIVGDRVVGFSADTGTRHPDSEAQYRRGDPPGNWKFPSVLAHKYSP